MKVSGMKGTLVNILVWIILYIFSTIGIANAGDEDSKSNFIEYHRGDVLAIGQAVYNVYVECKTPEELEQYTKKFGVKRGHTARINKADAEALSEIIRNPLKRYSGGGAANTAAGVAALGGSAGFIGAVARDRAGYNFDEDMRNIGVETRNVVIKNAEENTGTVFSFITTDGERTMLDYPGVSHQLRDQDINWDLIKGYKVVFLEGYMWDDNGSPEFVYKALDIGRAAGVTTAFALGSAEMAIRYRDVFTALLDKVDILFANEVEIMEMLQVKTFQEAVNKLKNRVKIAVITRGAQGAMVITKDMQLHVPAQKIEKVMDTTGAGDMFAAGFLYGYTHNLNLEQSAKLGCLLASRIIQQIGSHPERRLPELLKELHK